jgi:outer membrane receptor for ferrienterochelin and colicins
LDYDSWFGFYPTPKLSVRYELTPSLAVSSSYGLGYRAPSFKEMFIFFENSGVGYVVTGNPELEPEKMRGLNLGLNYSPVPVFSLRINGYRNDLENLITVGTLEDSESDGPTIFSYLNVEEAYTQGTELNARAVLRAVMITGGYALTDTKDVSNDRTLEGRPLHSGSGGLLWKGKSGTNASVNANFIGKRLFYVDINGDDKEDVVEADAYTLMNVRLGQSFASDQIEIFTGINNALDAGVSDYLALRPRWYFVGLKGLFQLKEQQ